MSAQPFMQLYVGDYLADTTDLTCEEHGAYLLLLMAMWRHGAKLPNDPKKLARIARLSPRKWASVWGEIERFFEVDGDTISSPRLTKEHQKARVKSDLRAQAGSKGGKAKALKTKKPPLANATDLPKQGQKSEPDIYSDTNVSGAKAPIDPAKIAFDGGIKILTAAGKSEGQARQIVGRWRKSNSDAEIIAALGNAQREGAIDPVGFVTRVLSNTQTKPRPGVVAAGAFGNLPERN